MFAPASLRRLLIAGALLLLLAGCSTTPQTRQLLQAESTLELPQQQELANVPFYPQEAYQCGPAALATVLEFSGVEVTPEALVPQVYVPERQGALQVEMQATTRQYQRLAYLLRPSLEELLASVAAGQPVLVLQNLGLDWYPKWHYAVVVGYDLKRKTILLRSGLTERYEIDLKLFERTWARGGHWALVVLRPGQLPVRPDPRQYFLATAAFERFADRADALTAWQAGLQHWPDHPRLLMGYGNFLYGSGQLQDAARQYRRVTEVSADTADAWNNWAQVMIDSGDYAQALELAHRAVEIGGRHADLYQQTLSEAEALNRNAPAAATTDSPAASAPAP